MTEVSGRTTPGMASGLAWTLTAMLSTRLVTLAGLAVLARLLAPADFGLLAFALAYITYLTAVGDLGTTMALIYWPTRKDDAAQVTFVISVVTGWLWLGCIILLAPAIAEFFGNPSGAPVVIAIAWSVPIQALGSTHDALCRKSLRFRTWFVPEVGLASLKAVISIALALAGFGVWSLVWGHLAGHLLRTVLLWVLVPWRPTLTMPWDLLGPMFAYGRSIVAVNVLAVIVHHSDLLIVARLLGVTALGFYQMAAKIPEMTITVLVRAVSSVLFPALSRLHAQGRNPAQTYLTTLEGVGLVTIPAAVGLILMAEPLVFILFGPRWAASIPIVQALTVVACLRALGTNAGDLLKAAGRPGTLVVLAATKSALLIPALVLAADEGMVAVALAMVAVTAATVTLDIAVACVLTRTSSWSVFAAMTPGVAAGAAIAAGLAFVDVWLLPVAPPIRVAIALVIGAAGWAGAVQVVRPEIHVEMLLLARRLVAGMRRRVDRTAENPPRLATSNLGT
jgi:O-antigen/teichoic acid export membrane protein